ncbi:ABC transporter G family member 23 isoform X2 [Halyomorpha halys]|nr:ABC transporter G family member 23-like isoform X2 [Halyomorpha halys]
MSDEKLAVYVKDAYKRYTPTNVILDGLNMRVPEGTIYGLLGPSGCGKTTLLSSIVGQRLLDSGTIQVSVKHKVQVGFMPQEIALNTEFTISEVFHFYGRICMMDNGKIEQRGDELIKFLQLPPLSRIVGSCSGGQQRRVSMAVTLLHNPKLLILDEPTVGVDPVLCNDIWEYFLKVVREEGKTIIITTHYIEEAKNSNMIGLMRGGILLAEEPPPILLQQYHCETLEEVFLKLSEKQEKEEPLGGVKPYPKIQPNEPPIKNDQMFHRERFMAQLIKNINWTRRNWTITLFVICLPALLFSIIGQLTTKDGGDFPVGDEPLALVNFESDCKNETIYKLAKRCVETRPLSCRYIDNLQQIFNIDKYETYDDALNAVKKSRAFGVVILPENFTRYMYLRLTDQSSATGHILDGSTVNVSFDSTDFGKVVRSTRELSLRVLESIQDLAQDCGFPRKLADIPITVVEKLNLVEEVLQSMLPPYFSSVVFYTTMMYTSTAIIMERNSGLFERSQAAGLTIVEILITQVVMQFLVMIVQNILSFFMLYVIDQYTMRGSMVLGFFLIILVQFCGMSYGFFLSVIISAEKNVAYAGIFTILSLFMLTGSLWPTQALHWLLKPFSRIIPITMTAEAYYNISLRGWSIAHYTVYMGIVYVLLGTVFFTVLTYLTVRFNFGSFT